MTKRARWRLRCWARRPRRRRRAGTRRAGSVAPVGDHRQLLSRRRSVQSGSAASFKTSSSGRAAATAMWDGQLHAGVAGAGHDASVLLHDAVCRRRASERFGDVLLNYRYQVLEEAAGGRRSPRGSASMLPTGREDERPRRAASRGAGERAGEQAVRRLLRPRERRFHRLPTCSARRTSPAAASGASTPMLNLMLEAVVERRSESVTVSPGFRRGWNSAIKQLVIGLAVPVTLDRWAVDVRRCSPILVRAAVPPQP